MEEKKRLYYESGAVEVWFCDRRGKMMTFFTGFDSPPLAQSPMAPDFPDQIG